MRRMRRAWPGLGHKKTSPSPHARGERGRGEGCRELHMKAPKVVFVCQSCGAQAPKWMGRCSDCGEWNTLVEERVADAPKTAAAQGESRYGLSSTGNAARLFAEVDSVAAERITTGISEFDRVL